MSKISFEGIVDTDEKDTEVLRIQSLSNEALIVEIEADLAELDSEDGLERDIALITTIKEGLENAKEEDTSLLDTFKKPLDAINIDTQSNESTVMSIKELLDTKVSKEGFWEVAGNIIVALIVGAIAIVGFLASIAIPLVIIYALIKLGMYMAKSTEENKQARDGKPPQEPENADKVMNVIDASETMKRVDEIGKFCSFVGSKVDSMKPDDILKFVSGAQSVGYTYKDGKLTPKSAITFSKKSIKAAGWNANKVAELESKIAKLGELLKGFDKVADKMKAAQEKAKEEKPTVKEEDKEKAKANVEKAKEAVAFSKQYSKTILRDAKTLTNFYNALAKEFK